MSLACTAVVEHGTVGREKFFFHLLTFSALTLSLGVRKGIRPVKTSVLKPLGMVVNVNKLLQVWGGEELWPFLPGCSGKG